MFLISEHLPSTTNIRAAIRPQHIRSYYKHKFSSAFSKQHQQTYNIKVGLKTFNLFSKKYFRVDQGHSIRLTVNGATSSEDCSGCYLQIEVDLSVLGSNQSIFVCQDPYSPRENTGNELAEDLQNNVSMIWTICCENFGYKTTTFQSFLNVLNLREVAKTGVS